MIKLANLPLTNVWFPDNEDRSRVIAAITTSAGAAGGVVTITIPNGYPPIDRTIPCPVLGIFTAEVGATLAANGIEGYALAGQMGATPASLTPDSAGEFEITGARTIDIWEQAATAKIVLVLYIGKGTGQET